MNKRSTGMGIRRGIKDKRGVTVPMIFVFFAAAASIFFSSLYLYQAAFIDYPSSIAIQQQFNDLGNVFSTKMVDAVIILPHGGVMEFEETLPQKIGGHNYKIDIGAATDQIQLYSFKGVYYNYTLSGMSAEVNASMNTTTAYGGASKVTITLKRLI